MKVTLLGTERKQETESLSRLFLPYEKVTFVPPTEAEKTSGENTLYVNVGTEEIGVRATVNGKSESLNFKINRYGEQFSLAEAIYRVLSSLTGITPPWGTLYGVRPVHLFRAMIEEFGSEEEAARVFKERYLADESKVNLLRAVTQNEGKITRLSKPNSFSLYIAIPFCPSRCSYCSFVSHSIEKAGKLIEDYVTLLVKEIGIVAKKAKDLGLSLETVYFGGGTPTTLSARDLQRLFTAIEENFNLSALREYTVEAGRPDTIDAEKLRVMKAAGVNRVSINPQTFNDGVLKVIGRRHTSEQTLAAYELALKEGFRNINMDFIAALQSDTLGSFKASIERGIELGAPSVTVHALALKSGANMARESHSDFASLCDTAVEMVNASEGMLRAAGYTPYYMYRQSKSAGNLENVGWCKKGFEGIYNIFMIDETHTVLSAGAGGVSLLKDKGTGKIERIYNYKYPYEYINNFEGIVERKNKIDEFYEKIN